MASECMRPVYKIYSSGFVQPIICFSPMDRLCRLSDAIRLREKLGLWSTSGGGLLPRIAEPIGIWLAAMMDNLFAGFSIHFMDAAIHPIRSTISLGWARCQMVWILFSQATCKRSRFPQI